METEIDTEIEDEEGIKQASSQFPMKTNSLSHITTGPVLAQKLKMMVSAKTKRVSTA